MKPLRCLLGVIAVVVALLAGASSASADGALHAYDVSRCAPSEGFHRVELSEARTAAADKEANSSSQLAAEASGAYGSGSLSCVRASVSTPVEGPFPQVAAGGEGAASPAIAVGRAATTPLSITSTPRTGGGLVDLASPSRRSHILNGEVRPNGTYGGGHRAGTGFPGKSEFPARWSDDQIMHHISDVATDPASRIVRQQGQDVFVRGSRDGIEIEVLIRNGEIWTGYPTNVPRNP